MFSLMGNCIARKNGKSQHNKKDVTLGIFGLDDSGKTTVATALSSGELTDVVPTAGFDSVNFKFDKRRVALFDVGGGPKIRGIWIHYLAESYGIIFVVDKSDVARLDESRKEFQELISNPLVSKKPVLLLANKSDKLGATLNDVKNRLRVEETVNENKCPCSVVECTANKGVGKKTDKAITDGLRWLLAMINHQFPELEERVKADTASQREREAADKARRFEAVRKMKEERNDTTADNIDDTDNGDPFKPAKMAALSATSPQKTGRAMLEPLHAPSDTLATNSPRRKRRRRKQRLTQNGHLGQQPEGVAESGRSDDPRCDDDEGVLIRRAPLKNRRRTRDGSGYDEEEVDDGTRRVKRPTNEDSDSGRDSGDDVTDTPRPHVLSRGSRPTFRPTETIEEEEGSGPSPVRRRGKKKPKAKRLEDDEPSGDGLATTFRYGKSDALAESINANSHLQPLDSTGGGDTANNERSLTPSTPLAPLATPVESRPERRKKHRLFGRANRTAPMGDAPGDGVAPKMNAIPQSDDDEDDDEPMEEVSDEEIKPKRDYRKKKPDPTPAEQHPEDADLVKHWTMASDLPPLPNYRRRPNYLDDDDGEL